MINMAKKISHSSSLQLPLPISNEKKVADVWGPRAADVLNDYSIGREYFIEQPDGSRRQLQPSDWNDDNLTFDYRNFIQKVDGKEYRDMTPPALSQGNCGNCYAAAASNMYTSRLKFKYPELHAKWTQGVHERIDLDQATRCNWFNQGCEGGYPWLNHLWSSQHDMVTDKCWGDLETEVRDGFKCLSFLFKNNCSCMS